MKNIKTVLVTGGAGYVGAVLVPKLLKKGYTVKVIDWYIYGDVFKPYKSDKDLIQYKGDLRDKALVEQAIAGTDAVIHLACISNDPSFELDPRLGKSVNYDATLQLGDLAAKYHVQRFIYASSSSVYGIKEEAEVTEDLPLEPLTDYSKYKALCEDYLLKNHNANYTLLILRPSTICGYSSRLRLDLTVNMLTLQALVNKKITVFGGKQKRPNIHIEDITDLYVKTLEYPDKKIAGKIYNAGYENYPVSEIAQMIKRTVGDDSIEIVTLPTNDLRSYHVSSKKINKELGFTAVHTVEDAILDLQKAYEKGLISDAMTDPRYYNIKMMQSLKMKPSFA